MRAIYSKAIVMLAFSLSSQPACAQSSIADFYKGKTITIGVGGTAGGGYDIDARVLSRHLGRFIPGNPSIVVQNVPGARGLTNANRLYATSKRDGTAIAVLQRGLLTAPWLNSSGVQYDVFKFNWLFSTAAEPGVVILWHTAPQSSAADIQKMETIIGGAGDSAIIPQVYNATIGTKFKIVTGYPGTADLVMAMQRGEIQGIGYYSWSNISAKNPSWIRDKLIKVLMQTGDKRHPELPNVPLASELAIDSVKLQVQDLWLAPLDTARPYAMPPETPEERVIAVRGAFHEMVHSPDFLDDAKRAGMSIDVRSAQDILGVLNRIKATPPNIIEEARRAVAE